MSEDDLLRNVLQLAKLLGLRTAHFRPGKTTRGNWITAVAGDGKGFPDLVIVGPGGVAFRELKAAKGRISREQADWAAALILAGASWDEWRPADWGTDGGRIRDELKALTHA